MNTISQALELVDFSLPLNKNPRYTYNGVPVPRVTEILSKMIHSDGLMYWANSIGLKGIKYSDMLNAAADVGTNAHNAIEDFLINKLEAENNIPFLGFLLWYRYITTVANLPITTIYIEHRMSCKWFGGTLDALMNIGNKIFLVDFKTSNHVTFNYFLQLAAYRYMLRLEGINVDGVIVLQLDKSEPGFNEYVLDLSIPEHGEFFNNCEETFLSLVYSYYQLSRVEKAFKDNKGFITDKI